MWISCVSTGMPRARARCSRMSMLPRSPYVERRSGYTQTICKALDDTVQLRSDVLERAVVGDDLQPPGRRGVDGLGKARHVHEVDAVDLQPHGEVVGAFPGDEHLASAQRGEVDVEQPAR